MSQQTRRQNGSTNRYGAIVTRRLRAMGIRDKPTAPASPWQNGFAERLIGSIRRECVDHFVVLVRRICAEFFAPMLDITTTSERTGHWTKMRRSLAPFSEPESLVHTRSLVDFITTTSGFSVHTPLSDLNLLSARPRWLPCSSGEQRAFQQIGQGALFYTREPTVLKQHAWSQTGSVGADASHCMLDDDLKARLNAVRRKTARLG